MRPNPPKSSSTAVVATIAVLIASGLIHLLLWTISGQDWEGPISLRKPALFGVSAGVTLLSLRWALGKLDPHPADRSVLTLTGCLLLAEVGLITLQYWRGVPSHFNSATRTDGIIEAAMLLMIAAVTGVIGWYCLRSCRPSALEPAQRLALRAGLWFLLIGCGLGFGATAAGYANLTAGRSPEFWGPSGVLKFPHGMALHAIQLFPVLAWCAKYSRVPRSYPVVAMAVASQALFLVYAVRQTVQGRSRFDSDPAGWVLLGISILLATAPMLMIFGALARNRWNWWTSQPTSANGCGWSERDSTTALSCGSSHVR